MLWSLGFGIAGEFWSLGNVRVGGGFSLGVGGSLLEEVDVESNGSVRTPLSSLELELNLVLELGLELELTCNALGLVLLLTFLGTGGAIGSK